MTTPPTAYTITTERLLLRPWNPADAPRLRAALDANDQHLRPWIPWMADQPQPLDDTLRWVREQRAAFDRDENYRYAIFDPSDSHLLGETGLYTRIGAGAREIGYWLDRNATGRGLATEATLAMIRVAFEISRVQRVELHMAPDNAPSVAVARRLGFHHEATLPRRLEDSEGRVHDQMIWSLYHDDTSHSARRLFLRAFDGAGREIPVRSVDAGEQDLVRVS